MTSLTGRARGAVNRVRRSVGADPALAAELVEARTSLRRTRRRLRRAEGRVADLKAELRTTRRSVRHPFPDAPLPDPVHETIRQARAEHLTYLSPENLKVLASLVAEADVAQRPGLVVEAGTALGGAAIVMAAAKAAGRPMKVYDVFGMIPPPSDKDGTDVHRRYDRILKGESTGLRGDVYYGYHDDVYGEVKASFARLGVPVEENDIDLVQGLFQDTIDLDEPVAFAHLDGDWYESTKTCLERIVPLLQPGGRIVLDDYYAWSGCTTAVDEYFADHPGYRIERRARLHVVRP